MIFDENELIPISALAHFHYCDRRCALIHIEHIWAENLFTAEGRILHEKAHEEQSERRGGMRVEYGIPLRSLRLGVIGKADVVEFHRVSKDVWQPFPIEYKRGKPKPDHSDMIQLCAQAVCLEEMLNCSLPGGALYYGRTRHREAVIFDSALRKETEEISGKVHALLNSGRTPTSKYSKKCKRCSLLDDCQPKATSRRRSVENYLRKELAEP